MEWIYDTGGREKYYKALRVKDCVTRAIAIATGMDYQETYKTLKKYNNGESPRNGVYTIVYSKMLEDLGWEYISCSDDGNETVYLRDGELPTEGVIICRIERHAVAIVDGVIHDTFNSAGDGSKKVYGYWKKRCEEEDRMIESE